MKKHLKNGMALVAGFGSSAVAFAQTTATGPDLSSLTSGISMGTVVTGILAVGVTMVGLYAAVKGTKIIIGMVRGG